jgi:hypothetical protein
MITFKQFNEFDFQLLSQFNGIESTKKNIELLRSKIEYLYFNDETIDYSTKGCSWLIADLKDNSFLEILIDKQTT